MRSKSISSLVCAALSAMCLFSSAAAAPVLSWMSPNHYRVTLTADPRGPVRRNSPASVDVDFQQILASMGSSGTFDESSIEVVGHNSLGQPKLFDSTRTGYERYLLPWRVQKYYGITRVTLSFVMPDQTYSYYAVYFDTTQSGRGKPDRYPGIVGDGDWFMEGYGRREVNASGYDTFCDFDGDGDLDLFKNSVEPYLHCFENVGSNKYVNRGRMTSGGNLLTFPRDGVNRSFQSVEFSDWDNDGDKDMFIFSPVGPYGNDVVLYKNITPPGGQITFAAPTPLRTEKGRQLGSTITIVDWNGDGKKDVLSSRDGLLAFHENKGTDSAPILDDGVYVRANGMELQVLNGRYDCADIDGDGDLDLFAGMEDGRIYWWTNVGTRTTPVFTMGRMIAFYEFMDARAGIKVADFDGDGLLDFVAGRFWERTQWGEEPRVYGRLYKNVGTLTAPKFVAKDANNGSPYTERFQMCDSVRQNGVRAVDWNNDGKKDLIASDTDGFVWYFRNLTNRLFPVFATGERLWADGKPLRVWGELREGRWGGYARSDVCDWNNDGKKDLLVADGRGYLWLYLNQGTDAAPVLGAGTRLSSYDALGATLLPIDGTARASVLVCDWNNDGKKDIILGMVGEGELTDNANWPQINGDPTEDRGFLFYRNVGTDTGPVLAYPKWIRSGPGAGTIIDYSRPNLGSYVDWDGDGKKDFIGGEFENSIRFYKNMGTGGVGVEPQFTSSTEGVHIVQPWTAMMISGADALDWNGDGDIDIITGQGHGGSGLRFYERDYINDSVNNTFPIVTAGSSQEGISLLQAKRLSNGTTVNLPDAIVTGSFTNFFYVESEDRTVGVRVNRTSHGMSTGDRVAVSGSSATNTDGERVITATSAVVTGSGSIAELALTGMALGGGDFSYNNPVPGAGQMGVAGGVGLNNVGLLVRLFGRCTVNLALSGGDYYGARYIFVDDGSGVLSWYRKTGGSYQQVKGVKVEVNDPSIAVGDYVVATGISSIESVTGVYQRRLLPRPGMNDVVKL